MHWPELPLHPNRLSAPRPASLSRLCVSSSGFLPPFFGSFRLRLLLLCPAPRPDSCSASVAQSGRRRLRSACTGSGPFGRKGLGRSCRVRAFPVTAAPVTRQLLVKTSITGIEEKKIRPRGRGNSVRKGGLHILKNTAFRAWGAPLVAADGGQGGRVGAESGGRCSAGRPPGFQKLNVKVELVWMPLVLTLRLFIFYV